jgi:ElaB/YqjD/DUF883 family membrane-anchored ribosome-binding protein
MSESDQATDLKSSKAGRGSRESKVDGESSLMRGLCENARSASDTVRSAYREASAAASDFGGEAYEVGAKTGARIARQVEAQPMSSVLIAGSLGLVVGMLLARR